jgi:hypothetical protein
LISFRVILADKERGGGNEQEVMRTRYWFAVIALLLALSSVGCADTSASSDNDKRGVFYGGVSGGHTWP